MVKLYNDLIFFHKFVKEWSAHAWANLTVPLQICFVFAKTKQYNGCETEYLKKHGKVVVVAVVVFYIATTKIIDFTKE